MHLGTLTHHSLSRRELSKPVNFYKFLLHYVHILVYITTPTFKSQVQGLSIKDIGCLGRQQVGKHLSTGHSGAFGSIWAPSWFTWEISRWGLIFALTLIFGLDEHTSTHFFCLVTLLVVFWDSVLWYHCKGQSAKFASFQARTLIFYLESQFWPSCRYPLSILPKMLFSGMVPH